MQLARCNLTHPERDSHQVLVKKFKLALPLERSQLGGASHIPIIRIRTWFSFFLRNSCLHILLGLQQPHPVREKAILSAFWRNFQQIHPCHQVFQQASQGTLELTRAIPLLVHGDEGRGRRHTAHFVLSFHAVLGRGFAKQKKKRCWTKMECNFAGHTYTNRFLLATLRKKDYADEEHETWKGLMQNVAEECRYMWETGVVDLQGQKFWGVVIAIVGDWPFLHKSAGFFRSFNNIQKRVTVRKPPVGICHLCRAGQNEVPFEQLGTRRPTWLSTQFAENPFLEPSPFTDHILHEPGKAEAIWAFDWFHTMHLGVLKYFVGSVLALLSEQEPFGAIDDRFAALTEKFKLWCQSHSRRAHVTKLSKELIGWETTKTYPSGTWHKGALSTVLMEYLESRFEAEQFPDEPLLTLSSEACFAVQKCTRYLFRSSLWLEPAEAKYVSDLGFQFLRRYCQMAQMSHSLGRCLYIFQPKIHVFHHFMQELFAAYQRNIKALNPLAKSCQPSEDFIGRPSRLSRRVSSRSTVLHRIMDRYLQSAYAQFLAAEYLVRPEWWKKSNLIVESK